MRRTILALLLVLSAVLPARAQAPNTINTIAGGGVNGTSPTAAYLPLPFSAVRDSNGNTYISVPGLNLVYEVSTTNTLTVFAGTGISGFSGDGGPANQAQLSFPQGLAVDKNNNIFIADANNNRIRRVDTTGNITTVAGSEDPFNGAFGGDNGPATNARLNFPGAVAVDGNGDLFIADTNNGAVRRVDGSTQIITTIAGGGANFGCTGGAGNTAGFSDILGIAVDGTGNVFVADAGLDIVCEINASTQNVSTYAGTLNNPGTVGAANGDGGAATSAQMDQPNDVAVDSTGNLFITDSGNPRIRKVDTTANHIITTVAGTGIICGLGSSTEPACGDGGPAASAAFDFPRGVFVDSANNIVVADTFNMRVRVIAAGANPTITGFAGGGTGGDGGPATSAILGLPQVVAVDSNENVFALESHGERIRKIAAAPPNDITTVAGVGVGGATIGPLPLNGDSGPATAARFVFPLVITTDASGNFYILDPNAQVVRVINNQANAITVATVSIQPGNIATIAGNGLRCNVGTNPNTFANNCGDGGPATSASLRNGAGIAVDLQGNVYISDFGLSTIRIVNNITNPANDAAPGTITTHAGSQGSVCTTFPTNCGDGGPALSALLNTPFGLATDSNNNLFVADAGDNVIRKIDNTLSHNISTVVFNGLPSFGGDGGGALGASMTFPQQVAVDDLGNLFIGGGNDNVVRRVDAQTQTIITVAGDVDNLGGGFSGDGGFSTLAQIENFGVAVFKTAQGTHDIFIADTGSNTIRKVNLEPVSSALPASGATLTFAPTLTGQTSDSQFISLSNSGLDDLILSNVIVSSGNFTLVNSCAQGGAPEIGCFLQLSFTPAQGIGGTVNGTLTFTTNDVPSQNFSYTLTGTASNSPVTLTVNENPSSSGTVVSDPPGIDCTTTNCTGTFASGAVVTLSASGGANTVFTGWNTTNAPGATNCTTTAPCAVTLNVSQTVGANFGPAPPPPTFTLGITPLGNGSGTVTDATNGINCTITAGAVSGACSATVAVETQFNLTATATPPSVFVGWLTPCTGSTNPCQFSLISNQNAIPVFSSPAQPFAKGQVFLTLRGFVFVLDPSTGNIVQVLGGLVGEGQGMAFDSVGNLYVTNSGGDVQVYSNQAAGPTLLGPQVDANAGSAVVDPFGNIIVGYSLAPNTETPAVQEFAPGSGASSTPSAEFFPAYESTNEGPYWIELLDSSDTIAYTMDSNNGQGGRSGIKIFDLSEGIQHPDILPTLQGDDALFALRELPDESLLVAASDRILRMGQNGAISQSYLTDSGFDLQNLNLDPDGTSFWTDDQFSGALERINIASGNVISNFTTNLGQNFTGFFASVGGIAVFGQAQSGGADLAITMTGPASVQTGANLTYTITVTNNGPLNATGVAVTDALPGGLSGSNLSSGCTGTTTITCAIGALNSGQSAPAITITVSPNATGTLQNTATVAGAQADPNLANNSATVSTNVVVSSGPPSFTSTTLPNGEVGLRYGTDFQVTGGTQPYTFAITSGTLPAGIALDPANPGHIFGTPTTAGTSSFTVKVTDSTNTSAAGNFSITIAAAPTSAAAQLALLTGQYAALLRGADDPSTSIHDAVASFNFDGKGNVTILHDDNDESGNLKTQCTDSGTYSVGADNRGLIAIPASGTCVTGSEGGGATVFAVALGDVKNGVASTARFIKFDDDDGNEGLGAGILRRQNQAAFTSASLAGTYVLGLTGQDSSLGRAVELARVTFDNNLGITSGSFDLNDNGSLNSGTLSGSYTKPDTNGRSVLTVTIPGLGTFTSVIYIVNTNEVFILSLDPTSTNILFAGDGLRQFNPNSFSLSSLAGPDIVSFRGTSGGGTSAGVGVLTASVVNNVGNFSVTADINDGGNLKLGQVTNGTYTMASNGRAVVTGQSTTGSVNLIVYLIRPDRAFFIGEDSSDPPFGDFEPQVGAPFPASPATPFTNNLFFGEDELVPNGKEDITGVAVLAPSDVLNVTGDDSHSGGQLDFGESLSLSYTVDSTGHFTVPASGTTGGLTGYVVSPFEARFFDTNGGTSDTATSVHPSLIIAQTIPQPPGVPAPPAANVNFAAPVATGSNAQSAPVSFTNSGVGPLTLQTLANAVDFSAAGTCVNSLPVVLAPGQSCQVVVTFAPQSSTPVNTPLNETITIATDAGNISIAATGTAAGPGITITPSTTVSFGNQLVGTTSGTITITVTNTGNQATTLTGVTSTPAANPASGTNSDGFTIVAGELDCGSGTVLAANGGNCFLPVTFGPLAPGAVSSTITLSDSLGNQVITLNGTGTAPAISLNPTSLSLSTAPNTTSAAQSVTVTNSGTAPLHIAGVSLGGATPQDFAFVNGTTPCGEGVTVQPQAACTVGVDFTATSQATFTATVTISSDASNGVQTITLTGTGVVISIAPPPGGSTTATVNPGGTAVFPLVLSSTGLSGTATLTCTPPPQSGIDCTVVPGTLPITPNGITHAAIVVNSFCTRLAPPASAPRNIPSAPWLIALVGLALLASTALTKKRSLRLAMPLAAILLIQVLASSCGNPPKGPDGATKPGNYPLVITVTVGQASAQVTLNLIVN